MPHLGRGISNYCTAICGLIDRYAPLRTRYITLRPQAPWLTADIMEEKKRKRRLERQWRRSKSMGDKELDKNQRNRYNEAYGRYLSK